MDPISIITSAITLAASQNTSSSTVKDSYKSLKELIISRLGSSAYIDTAINNLEKKPDSLARREILSEELTTAKANQYPELVQHADELISLIGTDGIGINCNISQSNIIQSAGVSIAGNISGVSIVTGEGNTILSPKPWPRNR